MAEFVGNLLLSSFPNLTKAQVAGFVAGLLNSEMDLNTFKLHLRDFLVTLKVRSFFFVFLHIRGGGYGEKRGRYDGWVLVLSFLLVASVRALS